jgi:hypothetical protein
MRLLGISHVISQCGRFPNGRIRTVDLRQENVALIREESAEKSILEPLSMKDIG